MDLKIVNERIAFILDEEESNIIKEVVSKSNAGIEDLKAIVNQDGILKRLNNPIAKKMLISKLNSEVAK